MANQLKEELVLGTSQFDSNINKVIRKVEELKSKGSKVGGGFDSSMGKMIEKATGFNGSLGSLTTTVAKLGGALGLITSGVQLADWFKSSVREGLKLAEQGEGIRIAFERLNDPNLLANLRQQTHNTVTDLELMKQAIKFNDFKLPLDQIGTFLAFAQQKAKDTGESIDYMVNSIVTGLGRKSLPILDNLGLSAAEIKERMKEGGDMTTAVANIIKDKMQAAGGYVETAADRAKQKEVELQNELEELGRTFQPLSETASNFWHSMEIGAIRLINKLKPAINQLTELGRVMNQYENLGGSTKVDKMISYLGTGKTKKAFSTYKRQLAEFDKQIEKTKFKIASLGTGKNSKDAITQGLIAREKERLNALYKMRAEYVKKANDLHNSKPTVSNTSQTDTTTETSTKTSTKTNYAVGSVGYYENLISDLQKEIKLQVDSSEIEKLQKQIKDAKEQLELLLNPQKLDLKKIDGIKSFAPSKLNATIPTEPIVKDLTTVYKEASEQINNILDAYDMGIIGHDKAQQWIDEVNKTLQANKLKPIEIELRTDTQQALDKLQFNASKIVNGFEGIDNVINNIDSLADSIMNGANAWQIFIGALQIGMSVINGISNALEAVNTLTKIFGATETATAAQTAAAATTEATASATVTAAKANEAVAGVTASGAKMLFPLNIAAIAAGIAAVVGALALMGTFANGGVIGGNSYSGDRLLARVNSGEAILNQNQQKHLFTLLDGNHSTSINGGSVRFVIQGKDLVGTFKNYNNRNSKLR